MREIRIENVKPEILVHLVVALKSENIFLLKENVFEEIRRQATKQLEKDQMSFITNYGDVMIETVVELEKFSDTYYKIRSITANGFKVYGTSPWVDVINEIVIIDAG